MLTQHYASIFLSLYEELGLGNSEEHLESFKNINESRAAKKKLTDAWLNFLWGLGSESIQVPVSVLSPPSMVPSLVGLAALSTRVARRYANNDAGRAAAIFETCTMALVKTILENNKELKPVDLKAQIALNFLKTEELDFDEFNTYYWQLEPSLPADTKNKIELLLKKENPFFETGINPKTDKEKKQLDYWIIGFNLLMFWASLTASSIHEVKNNRLAITASLASLSTAALIIMPICLTVICLLTLTQYIIHLNRLNEKKKLIIDLQKEAKTITWEFNKKQSLLKLYQSRLYEAQQQLIELESKKQTTAVKEKVKEIELILEKLQILRSDGSLAEQLSLLNDETRKKRRLVGISVFFMSALILTEFTYIVNFMMGTSFLVLTTSVGSFLFPALLTIAIAGLVVLFLAAKTAKARQEYRSTDKHAQCSLKDLEFQIKRMQWQILNEKDSNKKAEYQQKLNYIQYGMARTEINDRKPIRTAAALLAFSYAVMAITTGALMAATPLGLTMTIIGAVIFTAALIVFCVQQNNISKQNKLLKPLKKQLTPLYEAASTSRASSEAANAASINNNDANESETTPLLGKSNGLDKKRGYLKGSK